MAIKVAVIGAGSITFTRRLVRDILSVPELQDTQFAFTDINARNLSMAAQLCQKDISGNKLAARVTATRERRRALDGAQYVINCARIGGLDAFRQDIEIPLKYGVDQCVGDTLCIGGIMYGQRSIAALLEFCRDMREVSARECLLLNYANPNAMNTWAALEYGGVRCVGLCHGVEGGHAQIAAALGARSPEDVDIICAGINHQTWYIQVIYQGRRIGGEELLAAFERHPHFRKTEKVRLDVLRRIGYYSTESNGHLSEYLPWYRTRPQDIPKWIDTSCWIHGETGGYLRDCLEQRDWFTTDFPQWLQEAGAPLSAYSRSHEHGSYIIESLETGRCYRGHFNVRNDGTISNLPPDCIVEVPGYVDRNGINIPRVGELPLACAASLSASVNVQRMSVRAAVTGDVMLLKQAVLHDPLTGAVCTTEHVWQMVDELLAAQARWLPQYAGEIVAARRRLKSAQVPKRPPRGVGATRHRVRTPAELRRLRRT